MKRLGVFWLGAALACAVIAVVWTAPALAAPEGKVVIAQGVDPTTLDPQWHEETPAYNVLLNIYDTLLFRDKDLRIIPWLAESWKMVTHTTWEFKLRKGVKFHNGGPDADAVKFSMDRLRDPKLGNRQAGNFRLVTSVDVVDTFTVRIVTSKPFPRWRTSWRFARRHGAQALRGKDKAFADRNPVGTGPYKFVRWAKDDQLVLEANDQWWGGAPKSRPSSTGRSPSTPCGWPRPGRGGGHRRQHPAAPGADHRQAPKLYISKAPSVRTIFIPIYTSQFDTANKPVGPVDGPPRTSGCARRSSRPPTRMRSSRPCSRAGDPHGRAAHQQALRLRQDARPVKHDPDRVKKLLTEAGFNGIDSR